MTNIIEDSVKYLAKMPTLGSRSAKKIILHLLKDRHKIQELIDFLHNLNSNVLTCEICGNLDIHKECSICLDVSREASVICVVEDVYDIWMLEKTKIYKGLYHVLGGFISPADNIFPENLNISSLLERLRKNQVNEIIFANNKNIKSQTTIFYLVDLIKNLNMEHDIKITELAHGIPFGAGLEYLDEGTLIAALRGRSKI